MSSSSRKLNMDGSYKAKYKIVYVRRLDDSLDNLNMREICSVKTFLNIAGKGNSHA